MYYFYIYKCKDNTLYCGSTKDLQNRERLHSSGKGAKYTRIHGAGKIVYFEKYESVREAMHREIEVKKWSKMKKLTLIDLQKTFSKKK